MQNNLNNNKITKRYDYNYYFYFFNYVSLVELFIKIAKYPFTIKCVFNIQMMTKKTAQYNY